MDRASAASMHPHQRRQQEGQLEANPAGTHGDNRVARLERDSPAIATEKALIEQSEKFSIKADVLIAPHHGADNASSMAFIKGFVPHARALHMTRRDRARPLRSRRGRPERSRRSTLEAMSDDLPDHLSQTERQAQGDSGQNLYLSDIAKAQLEIPMSTAS